MAGKFAVTVKPIIKIMRGVRERDAFGALYIIDNIRYGPAECKGKENYWRYP